MELVHGTFRIGILYIGSIIFTPLFLFIYNEEIIVTSSAAGTYSILSAWVVSIFINADQQSSLGILCRLLPVTLFLILDITSTVLISNRTWIEALGLDESLGLVDFPASFSPAVIGAVLGVSFGYGLLKNFQESVCETVFQKAVYLFWTLLVLVAIPCQFLPLTFHCHGAFELQ